jgi:bifunctional UDP-N-acetylglucosamine pyrophosphorylase/glucosamine-1-phosphate N-acetyltransferase
MIQNDTQVVILAAGKATRFRTGKTKLLEKICGQEMIMYPTTLFCGLNVPTTLVVGYQKELIQEKVREYHHDMVTFAVQEVQRGTGHAILSSKAFWHRDNILICNGDCPLITQEIIEELYAQHSATNAAVSFVTAHNADASLGGYGRVVKADNSIKIVEAKDFVGDATTHCCVNAGIYLVKRDFLESAIVRIGTNNKSNEFYFTDIIELASLDKQVVTMVDASFDRIRGINTLQELWIAEQIKRAELIRYWMESGVQFSVAQNVHIDLMVSIGSGSRIGSGVQLLGHTIVGSNCDVQEFSLLENAQLEDSVTIYPHSIVKDTYIEREAAVGPFVHLFDNTRIGVGAVVGTFVEIKNSCIDAYAKAEQRVCSALTCIPIDRKEMSCLSDSLADVVYSSSVTDTNCSQ